MLHFYTPCKHQKPGGFLMFSGGILVEYWLKMRQSNSLNIRSNIWQWKEVGRVDCWIEFQEKNDFTIN